MSKEDINLPKTSFSMKANLPNKEPEILKTWEKLNLYNKLRESRKITIPLVKTVIEGIEDAHI